MAGCTVPPAIDRAVPEHWHWPEERAAAQMQRGMWDAGVRLIQVADPARWDSLRSEEHTSELQSLMRISYAVFCLKKKKNLNITTTLNKTQIIINIKTNIQSVNNILCD